MNLSCRVGGKEKMKEIIVFGLSNEIGGVENYLLSLQKQLEQ